MAFGLFLAINGMLIIKHKKYGLKEGLPFGNYFEGTSAIVIGAVLTLIGIVLIIIGLKNVRIL